MPAYRTRFNSLLCGLLLVCGGPASGQSPTLTAADLEWLGQRIYNNECGGREECLTSWNIGENFPSLGIGHFIWYRQGQSEIYQETFPQLLQYLQDVGVELPDWLADPDDREQPWPDREAFQRAIDSEEMQDLRTLLRTTQTEQAAFIVQRLEGALPRMLNATASAQHAAIRHAFTEVAHSAPPLGLYALIDYVHFKGEGTAPSEHYGGMGWGLLQVLQQYLTLPTTRDPLDRFADAAADTLRQRVERAPPERQESRWLQGWLNRVAGYRPGHGL